jgi:lysophospholipase L1-like esterase
MIKNFKWLLLVSLTFVACNSDDAVVVVSNSSDGLPLTAGSANFAKYVALGDSFAAGYSDGALFIQGQEGAYPNVMAQQFALVGGGAFTTPLMADNIGGLSSGGNQIPQFPTRFYFFPGSTTVAAGPVNVSGVTTTALGATVSGPFNNMGVPGAKSFHLVTSGYGTLNPYFGRFASSLGAKVIDDAVAQSPSFFSLWIGGNDVLSYALSGGTGVNQTVNTNPATYGIDDITNPNVFAAAFSGMVNSLTAGGSKGVVANLAYITALPNFTTIPLNPIAPYTYFVDGDELKTSRVVSPGDIATINALNAQLYGPLKQILTALNVTNRIDLLSTTAANPVIIKDESLTNLGGSITLVAQNSGNPQLIALAGYLGATFGQVRQTKTGDLIPLRTQGVIGTPASLPPGIPSLLGAYGITYPLEDKHVLIPSEIAEIKAATDAFNVTIKAVADSKGLAFVDVNALMEQAKNGGVVANGFTVSDTFVTGGFFSLDGIHPSPRGYAVIANKFTAAINATYGSNLKAVDLGNYRILFPKSL